MPKKGTGKRKKEARGKSGQRPTKPRPEKEIGKNLSKMIRAMSARDGMVVAFSGGVDSSVLAKLAWDALGPRAVAVTAKSESLARSELRDARRIAKKIGIEHMVIKHSELDNEFIVQNPENRCYYCRRELADLLWAVAEEKGLATVADGVNMDDFDEHRPGIVAADEAGIWHPFIEFRVGKSELRTMAKLLDLEVHDKPAAACLSSRIPYGEPITREKLSMVEQAEDFLKRLGFNTIRVRHHGEIARIETSRDEMERLLKMKGQIVARLKKLGFKYVAIDLEGYRPGSLDEVLRS
jgi:uncharacterized protein